MEIFRVWVWVCDGCVLGLLLGVKWVLCWVGVFEGRVCQGASFYVQGLLLLFNDLCSVVYCWCYLLCFVLFNLSGGFYNVNLYL